MTDPRVVRGADVDDDGSSGVEKSVIRSEEVLRTRTTTNVAGGVRVRKTVEERPVQRVVPRTIEDAHVEKVPAEESDSGLVETLPDGSISIPVFEERLVVEKKLVVRERIIIRKLRVTEERQLDVTLRRERVEIHADPEVASRVKEVQVPPPSEKRQKVAQTKGAAGSTQSRRTSPRTRAAPATAQKTARRTKPKSNG